MLAGRNSTSVLGTRTSRICRFPASKTSLTMCRSSGLRDWLAVSRSRSSCSVITPRPAPGSPPNALTTRLVDFDSSQTSGRASVDIRSSSGAAASDTRSARCKASRLGASSPRTRGKKEITRVTTATETTDAAPSDRWCLRADINLLARVAAPKAPDARVARVTPICTVDRKRLGSCASLAGRSAPPAPPGQGAHLAFPQRDERHLGCGEKAADHHNNQDNENVPADVIHFLIPDLGNRHGRVVSGQSRPGVAMPRAYQAELRGWAGRAIL